MCDVLDYISDEKIKTTRDQVTTQSNIPVSNVFKTRILDYPHCSTIQHLKLEY